MKSGGTVVASDIAVHREIYADAAEYFNPYSVTDLLRALSVVIGLSCTAHRDELIARGTIIAERYSYEAILHRWQSFLATTVPATA